MLRTMIEEATEIAFIEDSMIIITEVFERAFMPILDIEPVFIGQEYVPLFGYPDIGYTTITVTQSNGLMDITGKEKL